MGLNASWLSSISLLLHPFFTNLSDREETNQSIFSHNKVTVCVTARFSSNVPQKAWYQALNMAFLNSETNLKKAIKTYMYI